MAAVVETNYSTDKEFECPACGNRIAVVARIQVNPLTVRNGGSEGFRKPIHVINVETKLIGIKIDHECCDGEVIES